MEANSSAITTLAATANIFNNVISSPRVTATAATLMGGGGSGVVGGMVSSSLASTVLSATAAAVATNTPSWLSWGRVQIPLYATILMLAVIGNFLVIITLVQNRRMRTITNVFLLNLAVSDILLGVLCMPFTLIGALLRDFVFGEVMCKVVPYLQGKRFLLLTYYFIIENFISRARAKEQRNVKVYEIFYRRVSLVLILEIKSNKNFSIVLKHSVFNHFSNSLDIHNFL